MPDDNPAEPELIEQLLISGSFFERCQILPVEVFNQCLLESRTDAQIPTLPSKLLEIRNFGKTSLKEILLTIIEVEDLD